MHLSMNLSSPQGCDLRTSHFGRPSMKAVTASVESTSIGPCRPNRQLTKYMALSVLPSEQLDAPQMQPQSVGGGLAVACSASMHVFPWVWSHWMCAAHVLFAAPLPGSLQSLQSEARCPSTWMALIGAIFRTSRSRSGKKTASGSTFTVQSNCVYLPLVLMASQTFMKSCALPAVWSTDIPTAAFTNWIALRTPPSVNGTVVAMSQPSQAKMPAPRLNCASIRPGS
mmetsp:Transcript_45508/g.128735  ORF Transcript_45508/g.128735 Transcript_45508/m.128735 type:complete len:226 (+) Transcript_45508:274-951(+)